MLTEIIKIGNSRGLRIPGAILKQCKMSNQVNLVVKDHMLIITPYENTRSGWENEFKHMSENGDDFLIDSDSTDHSWDDKEWQW